MRKITALVLLFLLFLSFLWAYKLKIYTLSPNVTVAINDEIVGITNEKGFITLDASGAINLRLFRPGYWPGYLEENINVDSDKELSFPFYPETFVKFITDPSGAEIYIKYGKSYLRVASDGENATVPIGNHLIKIVSKGLGAFEKIVNFNYISKTIEIKLPIYEDVKVVTDRKLVFTVDGKEKGFTPKVVKVMQGIHTFNFYDKGFLVGTEKATVSYNTKELKFRTKKLLNIEIKSNIEGAILYSEVLGFHLLPTSMKLPEGNYNVTVLKQGYYATSTTIEVSSESTQSTVSLDPNKVKVTFDFSGEIKVDGKKIERPEVILEKGIHIFELGKDKKKWIFMRDVEDDQTVSCDESLSTVVIGRSLEKVTLNGKDVYSPAILNIPEGEYSIVINGKQKRMVFEAGKVYTFPENEGFLIFNFPPEIFSVKLDGKRLPSVLYLYTVKTGKHTVEINAGCVKWTRQFEAKSGAIYFFDYEKLPLSKEVNIIVKKGCRVYLDSNEVFGKVTVNMGAHKIYAECGSDYYMEDVCVTESSTSINIFGGE